MCKTFFFSILGVTFLKLLRFVKTLTMPLLTVNNSFKVNKAKKEQPVFPLTLPKLIFNDYRYLKFLFAIFGVLAETRVFFPWSNQRSPHVFFCLVWLMF